MTMHQNKGILLESESVLHNILCRDTEDVDSNKLVGRQFERKKEAILTFSLSCCFLSALSAAFTASRSAASHVIYILL